MVLTDLDQSELSARIVANLRGDPALRLSEAPAAEAQAQVRAGKQRAAVLLPAGFGAQASKALFGAATKPDTKELAAPEGNQRMRKLVALAERVLL